MAIITVQSLFSGAGATTIVANLSNALLRKDNKVIAVDLCPHNDLRLWYGMPIQQQGGWAKSYINNTNDSRECAFRSDFGAIFFPLGYVYDQFEELTSLIEYNPHRFFSWLSDDPETLVIINLPSQSIRLYQALIEHVDLHLCVWQPEPRVYPRMQAFIQATGLGSDVPDAFVFLENAVAPQLELNRDISDIINHELSDKVTANVGIMRDQHLVEALATQQSCYEYSVAASANADFSELATWVAQRCSRA